MGESLRACRVPRQLRVVGDVEVAGEHPLAHAPSAPAMCTTVRTLGTDVHIESGGRPSAARCGHAGDLGAGRQEGPAQPVTGHGYVRTRGLDDRAQVALARAALEEPAPRPAHDPSAGVAARRAPGRRRARGTRTARRAAGRAAPPRPRRPGRGPCTAPGSRSPCPRTRRAGRAVRRRSRAARGRSPARAARSRSRGCMAGFGSTAISRVPAGRYRRLAPVPAPSSTTVGGRSARICLLVRPQQVVEVAVEHAEEQGVERPADRVGRR